MGPPGGMPPGPGGPPGMGPDGGPPMMGPPYRLLREEEDWTFLKDPKTHRDWADDLKYIPLGNGNSYLTLGGEIRQWFERFRNEEWGNGARTNEYLMQRYMFHADFHLGRRFRVFAQLKSGLINGRTGGPRESIDKDVVDINQAWLDINLDLNEREKPAVTLRVGRQELHFGNGRLVSAREGPTVRAGFDGARVIVQKGAWRIDGWGAKPVNTTTGAFDDKPYNDQTFWGVYGSGKTKSSPFNIDWYYLGLNRKVGIFNQGIGPELRHTVGGRIYRGYTGYFAPPGKGWDYDFEAAYQWGRFGPGFVPPFGGFPRGNIRAWTVSSETGYSFAGAPLQPRLSVNTGIASGDKDPNDPNLQTFFAPFPNGHYFGAIQTNGPLNVQGVRPAISLFLPKRAKLTFDTFFFYRQSTQDGLYNIPGYPLRFGGPSTARVIGTQPGADLFWPMTQHIVLELMYAHFITGKYLQESPPGKNLGYAGILVGYRF